MQSPVVSILQLVNVATPCLVALLGIVFVMAAPARWGRGGTPVLLACIGKLLLHVVHWAVYAFVVPSLARGNGADIPVILGFVNLVFSFAHTAVYAVVVWAVYLAATGAGSASQPQPLGAGPIPAADPRYAWKPPAN